MSKLNFCGIFKKYLALILFMFVPFYVQAGLFNPHVFTLENGLQVVVIENHRSSIVSHGVWYKLGSADDPQGKSGLAHYLEHMMFRGNTDSASSHYQTEISKIGGKYNAFTGNDMTNYYATVSSEHLEKVVSLEAARMRKLNVIDEQAKSELNVVLQERNMRYENNPIGRFYEILQARFLYNHPYRLPGIGWEHEIRNYQPQDVRDFHQKWIAPNNAIVIFAGDVTVEQAQTLTDQYYRDIPAKKLAERFRLSEPPHRDTIDRISITASEVDVPYFFRLYQAPNFKMDGGKHHYAMQVLQYILEMSPKGILHQQLVEEQQLATFININHTVYTLDPNIMCIVILPSGHHTLPELEQAFDKIINRLMKTGISAELVKRAQRQIIANSIFAHDHVLGGAQEFGDNLALGILAQETDEWIDRIKTVTPQEVNATFRKVFGRPHHLTAYLLPADNTKKENVNPTVDATNVEKEPE